MHRHLILAIVCLLALAAPVLAPPGGHGGISGDAARQAHPAL